MLPHRWRARASRADGAFTAAAGVGRPDLGPLFVGEQGQIEGTGDMGKGELAGRADIQQRDALVPHGQKCGNVLNWGHDDPLKSKKVCYGYAKAGTL